MLAPMDLRMQWMRGNMPSNLVRGLSAGLREVRASATASPAVSSPSHRACRAIGRGTRIDAACPPAMRLVSLPALATCAAPVFAFAAAAAGADLQPTSGSVTVPADWWTRMIDAAATALAVLESGLRSAYDVAPALVAGLAVLALIIPLAMLGGASRWIWRMIAAMANSARDPAASEPAPGMLVDRTGFARPLSASIEWSSAKADVHATRSTSIARALTRIGRATDNDIAVTGSGIENYHAAIERTAEMDHYLVDLTGATGQRVCVNGVAGGRRRLHDGDVITIGSQELVFRASSRSKRVEERGESL